MLQFRAIENTTYDEVNQTPNDPDETYSRLRTIKTKINPSYELQRIPSIDQISIEGVKQNTTKNSQSCTKFSIILFTMTVILLLFTFVSIIISVATYNRLIFEQSRLLGQIDGTNVQISVLK